MQTVIHIKADKEVKENAQMIAKQLGLTLSDIINAALRNFIRTREVIFSSHPRMTPELEKVLEKVDRDIKRKKASPGLFRHMRKWTNSLIPYEDISSQAFSQELQKIR